jgi:PAS domain S-box-containing protein
MLYGFDDVRPRGILVLREKWFESLIRNLPDFVALIDAGGIVRFVNLRVEAVLGFKTEEVVGHNIFEFVHPDDAPRATAEFAQTVKLEGEGVPSVLRLRDAYGKWVPFEIIGNNQLGDSDVGGIVFVGHDLRFRVEIEEAIRSANLDLTEPLEDRTTELAKRNAALRIESQSRLQTRQELQNAISLLNASLDATADGLLVVSMEGKVSSCNSRFLSMWGLADGATVGKADADLLSHALPQIHNSKDFLRKVNELYSRPEATSFDVIQLKDGRIFERYSQPQRIDHRVVGRVWSFRDVTQSRKLEEELRQSQKMEAVGRLAGGMAHDFNNLLMLMTGYMDQLIHDPSLSAEHKKVCEQVMATTRRGASLTRQLLAFSRKDQTAPRVADLNTIVLDMEPMLRRLISDVVQLRISLAPEPLYIFLDVHQVELVILNLAINAQDAMPAGGTLSITTNSEALAGDKKYAVVQVRDTGHGMTEEVQSHIFEPFFTTKEKGRGTGLGLATVYGIVQRSGGQIRLNSRPGDGACFSVYLPHTGVAPRAKTAAPAETAPVRGHETILLAEDEDGIRTMTRAYLESMGYRVLEAGDGTEAINLAEEYRGPIDLVLTDVLMPGMRGDALVKQLRRDRPAIRALLMSGFPDTTSAEIAVDILEKPFEFPEMGRRIRLLLDRPAGETGSAA